MSEGDRSFKNRPFSNPFQDIDQTFVCDVPLAIEAREKMSQNTVQGETIFEYFHPLFVECAPMDEDFADQTSCNVTDYEFRYLCDRSSLILQVQHQTHILSGDPLKVFILQQLFFNNIK